MMGILTSYWAVLLTFLLSTVSLAQATGTDTEYSDAEKVLWMADHMKNVGVHAQLKYAFSKTGTLESGFEDRIRMEVTSVNDDASRNVTIDFFSGDRHLPLEPRQRVTGNQVLSVYLDGDLHEMHRLAKGSRPYFQRRLKMAFAENAKVQDVTIEFAGKQVAGKKVTVMPFVDDPKRSMFEVFANKVYEFTFSDNVPGALYRIHTVVPNTAKEPKGKPSQALIEETLTLVEATAGK